MPGDRLSHSADKAARKLRVPNFRRDQAERKEKTLLILPTGIADQISINHNRLEGKGFPSTWKTQTEASNKDSLGGPAVKESILQCRDTQNPAAGTKIPYATSS